MATIVLTGGGSAGHCTPHLALLPYLKKDFDKIYYIGSLSGIERDIIRKHKIPYYGIPCAKLNRSFTLKNFTMPFTVLSGIKKAGKILDKLKPDVIFSKGGYVSVPTVIAGKKRNIPIIAHESDYTVGLANKITANYCKLVLTSFPETALSLKNGKYVGSPIRKINIEKDYEYFSFNAKKPVLLVLGGSLGAKAINNVVRECLDELLKKFDIIHICGKGNLDKSIDKNGYYQTEFMHNIDKAFSVASVCVSRAGSNALFELLSLKIPCLLIPLPKGASRGDQILNASFFEKQGVAKILYQDNLTKDSLPLNISTIYDGRKNLIKNFEKYPIIDKSVEISQILHEYAKN